jgi:hypothetical protein
MTSRVVPSQTKPRWGRTHGGLVGSNDGLYQELSGAMSENMCGGGIRHSTGVTRGIGGGACMVSGRVGSKTFRTLNKDLSKVADERAVMRGRYP